MLSFLIEMHANVEMISTQNSNMMSCCIHHYFFRVELTSLYNKKNCKTTLCCCHNFDQNKNDISNFSKDTFSRSSSSDQRKLAFGFEYIVHE